ncbi:sugar porter family MFS transporter [Haloferula sp.]|uniref:sugar porter family MFS transporter n=1 Tax=Haloferula sp. TaxID=2497595 RepID=UPI00329AB9D1
MSKLFFWSITCALAGFIFGFDLMVISGAEQAIQKLWDLTPAQQGWAISSAIWGTVIGALFGGIPANRFGRKKTLMSIGILYFVSALGSAYAGNLQMFMLARVIGGIGVGVATVAAPIFIAEISPARSRGLLTGLFQFNIVFGLLIATISNYVIKANVEVDAWRWMLGVEAIPAVIYSLMCFTLPESPRWLINNGRREEGKEVLAKINPEQMPAEIEAKAVEIEKAGEKEGSGGRIEWRRLKLPIMLAFLIAFFNQLSGINAILSFAPRIFGMTGIDTSASLLNSSMITLVNLVCTLFGLWLIDRIGRRTLLYIGSFGYIISLGICAWAFSNFKAPFEVAASAIDFKNNSEMVVDTTLSPAKMEKVQKDFEDSRKRLNEASSAEGYDGDPVAVELGMSTEENVALADAALEGATKQAGSGSSVVLICILGFIAAHALGQGTVIWVFISEIFPNRARAFGQSFGGATHWVFAALLTLFFPLALANFSASTLFAFFGFMMVLQLLWVHFFVPETKGRTLEELEEQMMS